MKKSALIFFAIVAMADLAAVTFNITAVNAVAKPLLVPALAVYYLSATKQKSFLFLTALFFCWLGDVLLMGQHYFSAGWAMCS